MVRRKAFIAGALLLVATVVCSGCASTLAPMSKRDTFLEVSWQVINAADAITTGGIRHRPDLIEGNPVPQFFLGQNPDPAPTFFYFLAMGLLHHYAVKHMDPKWRPWFQGVTLYHSGDSLRANCINGLC